MKNKLPQAPNDDSEMGRIIRASRIANGWTEEEMAAGRKGGRGLIGADDDDDLEGFRANQARERQLQRAATRPDPNGRDLV